jgi:hypothetical protein
MLFQGQVGAPSAQSLTPGTQPTVRAGQLGDVIVSELHGRYYETSYRKALFGGGNQAGVTTTAAFATTYTGLVLANPNGSAVNLVLNKVGVTQILAQTTVSAVGIMVGFSPTNLSGTTAVTVKSKFLGAPQGVGQLYNAATLPVAPTLDTVFGSLYTAAVTSIPVVPAFLIDLEGGLILPPGAYAALYTTTATTASSLIATMTWEEVPV